MSSCVLDFGTNRFAFGEGKCLDRRPSSVLCPKLIIPGRKRREGGGRLRSRRVPICAHLCETRGQAFWGESSHSRLQWPQSESGGKQVLRGANFSGERKKRNALSHFLAHLLFCPQKKTFQFCRRKVAPFFSSGQIDSALFSSFFCFAAVSLRQIFFSSSRQREGSKKEKRKMTQTRFPHKKKTGEKKRRGGEGEAAAAAVSVFLTFACGVGAKKRGPQSLNKCPQEKRRKFDNNLVSKSYICFCRFGSQHISYSLYGFWIRFRQESKQATALKKFQHGKEMRRRRLFPPPSSSKLPRLLYFLWKLSHAPHPPPVQQRGKGEGKKGLFLAFFAVPVSAPSTLSSLTFQMPPPPPPPPPPPLTPPRSQKYKPPRPLPPPFRAGLHRLPKGDLIAANSLFCPLGNSFSKKRRLGEISGNLGQTFLLVARQHTTTMHPSNWPLLHIPPFPRPTPNRIFSSQSSD